MKYFLMILACLIWGIFCGEFFEMPISIILAGCGGALLGWLVPAVYDKLK